MNKDSQIALKADSGSDEESKADLTLNEYVHVTITINFDKKTFYAKIGNQELSPAHFEREADLRAVQFTLKRDQVMSVKNLSIKSVPYTKPEIGVTITPPAVSNTNIGDLSYFIDENDENIIMLKVLEGRSSYSWSIDGVVQDSKTNVLSINSTDLSNGNHMVMVVVDGLYSASYILEK